MLQKHTISKALLELLEKIMNSDVFSEFRLVGGTALALQLGHRNSVDIDLFGNSKIDTEKFSKEFEKFGDVEIFTASENILICFINGIKVDCVNHSYPFLEGQLTMEGIRMATTKDISAMKLHAIEQRGSRKDFVDLFFLLKCHSLREMIGFFEGKYSNHIPFMMLQSLTYFRDAETLPMPQMYEEFDWEKCKILIIEEHRKLNI